MTATKRDALLLSGIMLFTMACTWRAAELHLARKGPCVALYGPVSSGAVLPPTMSYEAGVWSDEGKPVGRSEYEDSAIWSLACK